MMDLLLGFLRVGFFAFGGAYGAIPLIREVVLSYGWLTDEQFTLMIAVSESTPGPIMVNLATYVGNTRGGFPGAVLATSAVVLPSFVVTILVMVVLKNLIRNRYVQAVLRGLKPCIVGIVMATGIFMTVSNALNLRADTGLDPKALILTVLLAAAAFLSGPLLKKKISPILLILLSAVLGVIVYGV